MNEPFCSVYSKSYRPFKQETRLEAVKPCLFYEDSDENFIPLDDLKVNFSAQQLSYNKQRNDSIIRKLHIKRLISTYQASYCSRDGKNSVAIDPNSLEADQFMVYFNKVYGPNTDPILRPLDTSRTVHGYCRFQRCYTGLSTYQDEIGRQAYKYFKKDFDKGKSRLFSKKQRELLMRGKKALLETEDSYKTGNGEGDGDTVDGGPAVTEATSATATASSSAATAKGDCSQKEKICMICLEKYGDFCSRRALNKICEEL